MQMLAGNNNLVMKRVVKGLYAGRILINNLSNNGIVKEVMSTLNCSAIRSRIRLRWSTKEIKNKRKKEYKEKDLPRLS